MRVAAGRVAWSRWLAAAGPWRMWSVCPALLSPRLAEVDPHSESRPATSSLGLTLAAALRPDVPPTLALLDLDPVVGVDLGAWLYQERIAHPVLLLSRWPYAEAVLPVETLVEVLLRAAPATPAGPERRLPHVAFVVDGRRGAPIANRSRRDRRADNRSQLAVHDLPNLGTLRARGIQRLMSIKVAPA